MPPAKLDDLLAALVSQWRHGLGHELRPGASPELIRAAERRLQVALPEDMRRYFQVVDGMDEDDSVGDMRAHFWPVSRLAPIPEGLRGPEALDPSPPREPIMFVDYSEMGWGFAILVDESSVAGNPIVAADGMPSWDRGVVAASFSEFLEAYLASPDGLF